MTITTALEETEGTTVNEDVYREREHWRRKCVVLENENAKLRKALELATCHERGKLQVSFFVEWKTTDQPKDWKLYSNLYADPAAAIASYEAALKRPGCLDARIIERMDLRREVDKHYMRRQRRCTRQSELQLATPAECFGRDIRG